MNQFIHQYQSLFEVKIAHSPQELKAVHQLRYDVYVKERQWEPENERELEFDQFDSSSSHLIMLFKPLNLPLGTARMIMPNVQHLHKSYPMQTVCHHANFLNRQWIRTHPEFSRFAISKKAREECLNYAKQHLNDTERSYFFGRALSFGLIAKMVQYLKTHNFEGVCAILERPLLRLLTSNGLLAHKLGKLVEYHGMRQPCFFQFASLNLLIHKPESDLAKLIYLLNPSSVPSETKMSWKDTWLSKVN